MGNHCNSNFCKKSELRNCTNFSEKDRQGLFRAFWSMGTWEEKKTFVRGHVESVSKKQNKVGDESRRQVVFNYFLDKGSSRLQVCKKLFASTLGISEKTILNWICRTEDTNSPKLKAPKSGPHKPVDEPDKLFLEDWLLKIPGVPSHYCRKQASYEGIKFIFPGKSLVQLHADYKMACTEAEKRSVGIKFFSQTFKNLKLSFFVPRKDQCDVCISAKLGHIEPAVFDMHREKKTLAQAEKAKDKTDSGPDTSVWTMDLQAVLTCPKTQASGLYYKTKLTVHNMTYFDLKTKAAFNYVFDETNADLSSHMFAYLHHNHFSQYLDKNPHIKHLIVYSDGCGYQNKCSNVTNAFAQLAAEKNVTVEQKFLVSGHTQMECDSVHSVIERKIKSCDIYSPQDYLIAIQMSRQSPSPYKVKEIKFNEPKKLSAEYLKSIRPGKKTNDPTVSDVCAYQCSLSDDGAISIKFKLHWSEPYVELPCRISPGLKEWVPLYIERPKITARKYADLLSFKNVVPQNAFDLYVSLPHS